MTKHTDCDSPACCTLVSAIVETLFYLFVEAVESYGPYWQEDLH